MLAAKSEKGMDEAESRTAKMCIWGNNRTGREKMIRGSGRRDRNKNRRKMESKKKSRGGGGQSAEYYRRTSVRWPADSTFDS